MARTPNFDDGPDFVQSPTLRNPQSATERALVGGGALPLLLSRGGGQA